MRLIAELKDLNLIKDYQVDGWIVNIKGLSCYYDVVYSLAELKNIIKEIHDNNQKVYVNAKKLIHEENIDEIIDVVKELEILNVDYYFYSDMAFSEIAEELKIKHKLIYQVNTYMTNTQDIEIMLSENSSVVISTEISNEEITNIVKNIQKPVYLHAFGYYPIFHSRRELITNYQIYRGMSIDSNKKFDIVEELRSSHYPIEQNENGMVIYLDGAYYLSNEIEKINKYNKEISYILLSKFINLDEYKKIINLYLLIKDDNCSVDEFKKLNVTLTKGLLYEMSTLLKKEGGASCE